MSWIVNITKRLFPRTKQTEKLNNNINTTMAKKEKSITGLVLLRGKHAVSDADGNVTEVGISLSSQDDQEVVLEIAVKPELSDLLKVDELYNACFTKGKGKNAFNVVNLTEIDNGKYDEKMVIAGDLRGHLHLNIKPEQEDFFTEGGDYSLVLEKIEA